MKLLIAMSLLFTFSAQAGISETTLDCKMTSKSSCSKRVLKAFTELGCKPVPSSVKCYAPIDDPRHVYSADNNNRNFQFCYIDSQCTSPDIGNFGTVSCTGGKPNKTNSVDLKKIDSKLDLGVSVGLFRTPVTKLCID